MKGEQSTVGGSKARTLGRGVLDRRGEILILALDAVGGPGHATQPLTSAVGQVHGECVGERASSLIIAATR